MKTAPTLADAMIHEFSRHKYHVADPTRWLARNIAAARKFALDDTMSAFMTDLAYACMPKIPLTVTPHSKLMPIYVKRSRELLENIRRSARLPHAATWIEFSMHERIRRARDNFGQKIEPMLGPSKSGWLLLQHPKVDTAFMAIQCASHSVVSKYAPREVGMYFSLDDQLPLEPVPNASPMAYCWTVDDTVPPWRLMGAEQGNSHLASAMLTGVFHYQVPQVGWAKAPWIDHAGMDGFVTTDSFQELQRQLASDLRYLWALLAAINDTPVSYRAVTPTKGHMVAGSYKKFSAHTVITLQVPHKVTLQQLAQRVARAARRRAHQVRGHFRKDYRHPGQKLWVKEHQRGDASLGFVLHDYNVEHPI